VIRDFDRTAKKVLAITGIPPLRRFSFAVAVLPCKIKSRTLNRSVAQQKCTFAYSASAQRAGRHKGEKRKSVFDIL